MTNRNESKHVDGVDGDRGSAPRDRPSGVASALLAGLVISLVIAGVTSSEESGRLSPLPESEWGSEVREMLGGTYDRVAELEGAAPDAERETLNILRTVAHHPKLLGPFLGFATALAQEGTLTRRDSELLALRASWNGQSDFEWGHHVVYGLAAGLTRAEIDRIPLGPEAEGWSAEDRDLLLVADQLHHRQQIDDALWTRVASRYSEAQLVEIPFVVGQYTMLSMVANMTGVELEPRFEPLPDGPDRGASPQAR